MQHYAILCNMSCDFFFAVRAAPNPHTEWRSTLTAVALERQARYELCKRAAYYVIDCAVSFPSLASFYRGTSWSVDPHSAGKDRGTLHFTGDTLFASDPALCCPAM